MFGRSLNGDLLGHLPGLVTVCSVLLVELDLSGCMGYQIFVLSWRW